ncbi:flippase [Natrinema sp. H-ect1]|uniref:flippase n=1 Tax=Natrinema sp. H-ect1 TaxID=3242700 RepID=UPI00359E18FD
MKGIADLAKSAIVVSIGTIFGQSLGLLGELLIIQFVGPELLGQIGLSYAIVSTFGVIALLGVPAGVTRLLSANTESSSSAILSAGYIIILTATAISFLVFLLVSSRIEYVFSVNGMRPFLLLLSPYIFLYPFAEVLFSGLRGKQKSIAATISKWVVPKIAGITLLILLLLTSPPRFGPIVYWLTVPTGMILTSIVCLRKHNIYHIGPVDREMIRKLWRFSWPLALSATLSLFLTRLDLLILGIYVDATEVGYYRSIQPFRQITTFVSGSFGFLFLPLATQFFESDDYSALNQLYRVSTKWIISLTLPIVLVFCLFPTSVIKVFLGSAYIPASSVLSILIGGLFIRAIVGLDTDFIKAINRTKLELACAAIGVIANLILNFLLIPEFGIIGAAAATVVSFAIYNIIEVYFILRISSAHPFTRNNILPLIPTTILAILISLSLTGMIFNLLELIVIGILISIIHLLSLILTRSIDQNDIFLIEQMESRLDVDLTWVKNRII